ncbi:MAG: PASTA domain-containing protein, partial [Eggerthellaceae bacterium]|nr:PASTA domain-containing protein [Eggerthellaceae bacterium]
YKEPTVNWRDGGTMKMQPVEEEPQRGRDFLESSQVQKSNRSKIIVGVIAAVIAVAAIVAFATYQMQLWGGVALPNVIGMTEADAQSVLEEHGFTVKSMQIKSDDTEGLVLVMDPDASSRAEEGSEVIIHIASARIVPSIVGESQEKAAAAFKDEGFENIVYEKQSSDEPAGTVLSVTPEPGTRAKSAQEIIVKVAEPYTVPEVAGLYLDDAIAAIEKAGLAYDIAYVNTVDYPDGQIIGSQPAASEQVKSDTVVVIQIARARGVELENLTRSYLAPGNTVSIGIYNYAVESLDAVEYLGSETVAYTMTARPFTYILGETVSISARQVSGQVIFNEDNTIASIS